VEHIDFYQYMIMLCCAMTLVCVGTFLGPRKKMLFGTVTVLLSVWMLMVIFSHKIAFLLLLTHREDALFVIPFIATLVGGISLVIDAFLARGKNERL
jgi:hypothetical protein